MEEKTQRLQSLDAMRGFIMVTLVAQALGLLGTARKLGHWPETGDSSLSAHLWNLLAFHGHHPPWNSQFYFLGMTYWDLVQTGFMFMVGVAIPYSYAARLAKGASDRQIFGHACRRALILILLGVFLQTRGKLEVDTLFSNVLSQIGLGYVFVFLLVKMTPRRQIFIGASVLLAYWALQFAWPLPDEMPAYATESIATLHTPDAVSPHFAKGTSPGASFDKFLHNLFPRKNPYKVNLGGFVTLNFIPAAVTMLLGLLAGQLLQSSRTDSQKLRILLIAAGLCLLSGALLGVTICPVVKRIWTSSFTLFSGGWILAMLALFYWLIDVRKWRFWIAPFVVVGLNPLAAYLLGMLTRNWVSDRVKVYFGDGISASPYAPTIFALATLIFVWLACWYFHRQRIYFRI